MTDRPSADLLLDEALAVVVSNPHLIGPIKAELDPGIRETVRFVRDVGGLETTDSGDGVTKLAAGWDKDEAMDFPHVWGVVEPAVDMVRVAARLHDVLVARGVVLSQNGVPGVTIEASYDPVTGSAVVMLHGLNDAMLAAASPSETGEVK